MQSGPVSELQFGTPTPSPSGWRHPSVSWVLLAICLATTVVSWWLSSREFRASERARFNFSVEQTRDEIFERLLDQAQLLQGATALFAASASVEREEWAS